MREILLLTRHTSLRLFKVVPANSLIHYLLESTICRSLILSCVMSSDISNCLFSSNVASQSLTFARLSTTTCLSANFFLTITRLVAVDPWILELLELLSVDTWSSWTQLSTIIISFRRFIRSLSLLNSILSLVLCRLHRLFSSHLDLLFFLFRIDCVLFTLLWDMFVGSCCWVEERRARHEV